MTRQETLLPIQRLSNEEMKSILSNYKRVGFSGSRNRFSEEEKKKIQDIVDVLRNDAIVISGKCTSKKKVKIDDKYIIITNQNADRWSIDRAMEREMLVKEFPPSYPDLQKIRNEINFKGKNARSTYWYITKQNLERNQDIVDNSDILIALPPQEKENKNGELVKKGGTWDTIKRAIRAKKPVFINIEGEEEWIEYKKTMLKMSLNDIKKTKK